MKNEESKSKYEQVRKGLKRISRKKRKRIRTRVKGYRSHAKERNWELFTRAEKKAKDTGLLVDDKEENNGNICAAY